MKKTYLCIRSRICWKQCLVCSCYRRLICFRLTLCSTDILFDFYFVQIFMITFSKTKKCHVNNFHTNRNKQPPIQYLWDWLKQIHDMTWHLFYHPIILHVNKYGLWSLPFSILDLRIKMCMKSFGTSSLKTQELWINF